MRSSRLAFAVALSLAATLAFAAAGARRPLWNGRDLSGWRVFTKDAAAPAAVARPVNQTLRLEARSRGYLRTTASYSNYHLHFEWRWPALPAAAASAAPAPRRNSGVILHVNGPDRLWPAGYELQLLSGLAGELVAFAQDLPGGRPHPKDGLQRLKPLAASSEHPLGEWNTADVFCRGAALEIFVNDVRQNRVENLPVASGAIALQLEGSPVEFRHLWLEPL